MSEENKEGLEEEYEDYSFDEDDPELEDEGTEEESDDPELEEEPDDEDSVEEEGELEEPEDPEEEEESEDDEPETEETEEPEEEPAPESEEESEDGESESEDPEGEESEEEAGSEEPQETLSTRLAIIVGRLNDYIEKMAPSLPQAPGECAPRQANLYRVLVGVLELQGDDFIKGMELVTASFKKHRNGVFHERYVARDFQNISLPHRERLAFERLIRLFQLAAKVKNPSDVHRHMDIALLLDVLPARAHQNLLGYFPK